MRWRPHGESKLQPQQFQHPGGGDDAASLSGVPIGGDRVHGEGSGRQLLLALFAVRRGVESGAAANPRHAAVVGEMTEPRLTEYERRTEVLRELQELIGALDRRVPRVEREGEVSIARAAAALRVEALKRIQEIEQELAQIAPRPDITSRT